MKMKLTNELDDSSAPEEMSRPRGVNIKSCMCEIFTSQTTDDGKFNYIQFAKRISLCLCLCVENV